MADELKPCPFCGESNQNNLDYQYGTEDREGTPINVVCMGCGACGPWIYGTTAEDTYDADTAWNRRTP